MDLNLVVLCGRVAVDAEHGVFDSGASQLRLLVATRTDVPYRRLDVISVIMWDPPPELIELKSGERVWLCGRLQRRFWQNATGEHRRNSLEVVADSLQVADSEEEPVPV